MKQLLKNVWDRIRGISADTQGFVLMSTLAIFLFLFILCASIYAVGETIHQRIKIQNACDAAAYSAAVVQADGLSRMATVNRAMSWTYVQMTNRQMDYITYRWIKLTCKRFKEDKDNAQAYAAQMIFALDKELGWWAILEAVITAPISVLLGDTCASGPGHNRKNEGHSWWCGLGANQKHSININTPTGLPESVSDGLGRVANKLINDSLFTHDNLSSALNAFEKEFKNTVGALTQKLEITETSEPEALLGKLIDFDKDNIAAMNKTLNTINNQMNASMKMTAENVLKNMLKDGRLSDKELEDYYISIHIPRGKNPYGEMKDQNAVPDSFFSPMHNTEADEMLFLEMGTKDTSPKSLAGHFPIALSDSTHGYGLDQWFIRGRGIYVAKSSAADEKVTQNAEHSFAKQTVPGFDGKSSGAVDGNVRLYGTERSEGALGIQRVYKDTNLNEGRAGFFGKLKKKKKVYGYGRGEVIKDHRRRKRDQRRKEIEAILQSPCCKVDAVWDDNGKRLCHKDHEHTIETITEAKQVITRGNHLISLKELLENAFNAASNIFSDKNDKDQGDKDQGDKDETPGEGETVVDNEEDLRKEIEKKQEELNSNIKDSEAENTRLRTENQKLREQLNGTADPNERARITASIQENDRKIESNQTNINNWKTELENLDSDPLTKTDKPETPGGSNWVTEGGAKDYYKQKSPGSFLKDLFSAVVEPLLGELLDIAPSCDNLHGPYAEMPMCTANTETTALYADYRWASAKWFCVTTFWTWSVCTIFRKPVHCDTNKKKLKSLGFVSLYGKGRGHYHYPKMFCGARPRYAFDGNYNQIAELASQFQNGGLGSPFPGGAPSVDVGKWYNKLLDADPTGWARKLAETLPPLLEDIEGNRHGYMTFAMDFSSSGFLRPILPLFGKKNTFERDEFESCAMFPDGNFSFWSGDLAHAALIRGHARIYGDDKEIFDNRYVGAICKPWVLNERFFNGEGTIYVGAAMKHVNPFVRLFNMLSQDNSNSKSSQNARGNTEKVTQENNDKTIFSAFNIPQEGQGENAKFNYMWTMSAARAGVRHTRRNGAYDKERQYQVTYDSTCDAENLKYPEAFLYSPSSNSWIAVNGDTLNGWDDMEKNPHALSRLKMKEQTITPIWDGCPCAGSTTQLKSMWNLCETDWDATLLPLRYSIASADFMPSEDPEKKVRGDKKFNELGRDSREKLIFGDKFKFGDIGRGESWVWEEPNMESLLTQCPLLWSTWKKADGGFFSDLYQIPAAATVIPGVDLNLQSQIPEGKDKKIIKLYDLWGGKWL